MVGTDDALTGAQGLVGQEHVEHDPGAGSAQSLGTEQVGESGQVEAEPGSVGRVGVIGFVLPAGRGWLRRWAGSQTLLPVVGDVRVVDGRRVIGLVVVLGGPLGRFGVRVGRRQGSRCRLGPRLR